MGLEHRPYQTPGFSGYQFFSEIFIQRCIMAHVTMYLLGILLAGVHMQPLELEMGQAADVEDLFLDLFLEDVRVGRDLDDEVDKGNNIEEDEVKEKDASDTSAEVKQEEVARFNNYMDAVFRRMNAALRAKLMDPMELNLTQKT